MTAELNYFKLPAVSNSDLTALFKLFYGIRDNSDELEDIFNFGSLVDALLTELFRVDIYQRSLTQEDGTVIYYEPTVFMHAQHLADNCRKDPLVLRLLDASAGQYIFMRTLQFEYEEESYSIMARCKFDLFSKKFSTGVDFKSTACATRKQFKAAILHFHWDKQAAFYMDLAKIDRHWIIGISKKTGEVFKHAIERGDPFYESGRAKYTRWAYYWTLLIDPFVTNAKVLL
jgi:hypothetical protein